MTAEATQDEPESLTAPGKILRDRREKMGLTQAEVATRMRLSQQTIKDIEADDYGHFSAAIYVRGYIRNYAGILGLKSERLIQAFDEMGFVDQINPTPKTSYIASSVTKTARLHHSRKRMARSMSYVFFGLIIALVALWWHGQRLHKHAAISANILTSPSNADSDTTSTNNIPMTLHQETQDTHEGVGHVESKETKH